MKIKLGDKLKITDKYGKVKYYTYIGKMDEWYQQSGFIRKLKPRGRSGFVSFPESYFKECKIKVL